jgi:putative DNA primase/helicase
VRDVPPLTVAVELAANGIPTFPVIRVQREDGKVDKIPAITGWNKGRASIDPNQLWEWFGPGSEYLVGVPTGALTGFDALDTDPRNGGDRWINENILELPATVRMHTTQSGGTHYLFRHRQNMRCSRSKIAEGVDVRGDGGFIVWWPAHGYPADDRPLDQLPDWPEPWVAAAMAGHTAAASGGVRLERRLPPSAQAIIVLLNRLPHQADWTYDEFVACGLGTRGAIDALNEIGEITPEEEVAVIESWIAWGERWEGQEVDAAEAWEKKFAPYHDKLAAWQTLEKLAVKWAPELGAEIRTGRAQSEFASAEPPPAKPLILSPETPFEGAQRFVKDHHTQDGLRLIQHQQETHYRWAGPHYVEVPDEEIAAELYRFLEPVLQIDKFGNLVPYGTTKAKVTNLQHALAAVAQLPGRMRPPVWLDGREGPDPLEILVCKNGLLHLPTRNLLPPTPTFFALNTLEYDYAPNAPEPTGWKRFLKTLWPDDQQSVDTLQEEFGLLLSHDTSHHKMLLTIGPPRSGKGTIARVLTVLLGKHNVAGPTLKSITDTFGLWPLIGKPLAIISDARISGKADVTVAVERLLAISGGDSLSINRKNKSYWTGYLPTRFLMLSNELPRFTDASGAIATRFIVLVLTISFLGREDRALTNTLLKELPGILNWSLDGYDRLRKRGYFIQPASGEEALRELELLTSPIKQFLQECCVVGPEHSVARALLFNHWLAWCKAQNRQFAGTSAMFGRDLAAAVPELRHYQPQAPDGKQVHCYRGVGLIDPNAGSGGDQ